MSVYSIYRRTYIQLNEYWIKMYGLDINKKYYIEKYDSKVDTKI